MGRLGLKITCPCLRPELNFNLQTLVCICDGPRFVTLWTAGPHYKRPRPIRSSRITSLVVIGKPSSWSPRKLQWMLIGSLSQQRHIRRVTGNQLWRRKKIKRTFILFAADLPDFLDKYNHLPKEKKKKVKNRLSTKVRPILRQFTKYHYDYFLSKGHLYRRGRKCTGISHV